MKNTRAVSLLSIILALFTVIAVTMISRPGHKPNHATAVAEEAAYNRQSTHDPSVANKEMPTASPTDRHVTDRERKADPYVELAASSSSEPSVPMAASQPIEQTPVIKSANKPGKPEHELQDPMARELLRLVGSDANAEAYWIRAIFDTSLPDKERDDLIEDLNEEGLSDPKHPGPQDHNLIVKRLVIIEEVMPYADSFMVPHLEEAYKDLQNLLAITEGGGEPVR